ncbi:MAG: hypothetical protein IH577_04525 [Deltaproteobacteria bacterium]|nr:hypothetical protein [Deltaproteobacteria bacterium]
MNKNHGAAAARPIQMSLSFDPPPDFDDLDSLLIHIIALAKEDGVQLKTVAGEADLSPSELSMMLHRTRPFPARSVSGIIRSTLPHGLKAIYWLMDLFLTPQDVKVDRAAEVLERFLKDREAADKAALVIAEAMKKGAKK